jgi:predicted phosphodiesterase
LPSRRSYGGDAPREFYKLIEALPEFQLFLLGDFIESLTLAPGEVARLDTSERLGPILELMRYLDARVVVGNHDRHAIPFIRRHFGSRACIGGFRIGRLVFAHGHELGLDASEMAERVPMIMQLGGTLGRLGVGVPFGTATNDAVAAHYRVLGLYPIFGHTHTPVVSSCFANTGCFLDAYRSFVTIENNNLVLWEQSQ